MRIAAIAAVITVLWATPVFAAPFLVCDPYPGADYFVVTGLPAAISASNCPPDPTGTYGTKLDLATLAVGSYTVTIQACSNIWGCTPASSPLVFPRPNLGPSPTNGRLAIK
jgi:hypothetical protein